MFVYLAKGAVNHACDIIMNDCVCEVSAYILSTRVLSPFTGEKRGAAAY